MAEERISQDRKTLSDIINDEGRIISERIEANKKNNMAETYFDPMYAAVVKRERAKEKKRIEIAIEDNINRSEMSLMQKTAAQVLSPEEVIAKANARFEKKNNTAKSKTNAKTR